MPLESHALHPRLQSADGTAVTHVRAGNVWPFVTKLLLWGTPRSYHSALEVPLNVADVGALLGSTRLQYLSKCFGGNSMNLPPFERCATFVRLSGSLFKSALIVSLISSCQPLGANSAGPLTVSREAASPAELSDIFQIERSIRVEETGRSPIVLPVVTTDAAGQFLVADIRQHQIRRHDQNGKLLLVFGARGEGPGEFTRLAGAVGVGSRMIVAADGDGEIIYFSPSGTETARYRTALPAIHNLSVVNDTTVAITGRAVGNFDGALVHLWSLRQNRIVSSFFQMPAHKESLRSAYLFSSSVDVAVRGDTAAVTMALSDTVYLFTLDGQMRAKLPLVAPHFRRVQSPPPEDIVESADSRRAWSRTFSRISRVFWAPNGSLYVQFFDLDNAVPTWSLVYIRRDGGSSLEVRNIPRLLTVSAYDSRLYFVHPESEADTLWAIGRQSTAS